MSDETATTIACLLGAAGAGLVLVPRGRLAFTIGTALLLAAQVLLAYSLVPSEDLGRLAGSAGRIGLLALAGLALLAVGLGFARVPAAAPIAFVVAAPFRVPVELGAQEAFLLLPLYAVLVAAVIGLLVRLWSGDDPPALPRVLSIPAAAFVGLASVSLIWTDDLRAGTIQLLFFLFPLPVLMVVVARTPLAGWTTRLVVAILVGLASVFTAVGLSQLWTGELYFAPDLEVANAYTVFLRTTSLFADSSVYGRELGLAIVALLVAVYLGRTRLLVAAPLIALIWIGLFFSYSQSSMVALVVAVLAVGLLAGDRPNRRLLLAGTLVVVVVGGVAAGVVARGDSAARITSGRAGLVENTWRVFVDHPLVGVGVGSQPEAAREAGGKRGKDKNASHTTPLTVAAELGIAGLAAYVAFLVGAARVLRTALGRDEALGIGLIGCFVLLFVHSLFYSGFFENGAMWGALGLAAAIAWESPRRRSGLLAPAPSGLTRRV